VRILDVFPAHARAYARETKAAGGGEELADEVTRLRQRAC